MKINKILITLLLITLVLGLTGCDDNEAKILNAGVSTAKVDSLESKSHISWEVELENASSDQKKLKRLIRLINGMNLEINQKYVAAEKGVQEQVELDMKLNSKLKDIESKIWIDTDTSGASKKMLSIVQIPEEIQERIIDEELKEYIVFDFYEHIIENDLDERFMNSTEIFKNIMQMITKEFLSEYLLTYDFDGKSVEYIGDETINDEHVEVYKITMTDEEVKQWLKYSMGKIGESKVEIEKLIDEISKTQLIGEDGLEVIFKINDHEYLVYYEGFIDLVFDAEAYFNTLSCVFDEFSKYSFDQESKVKVKLDFTVSNYNFGKDIKIDVPELNESNSIYISDIERLKD